MKSRTRLDPTRHLTPEQLRGFLQRQFDNFCVEDLKALTPVYAVLTLNHNRRLADTTLKPLKANRRLKVLLDQYLKSVG